MPRPHDPTTTVRTAMEVSHLLDSGSAVIGLDAGSKKQALMALAELAARRTHLDARTILDVLLEREKLGTTGVGRGIAIPHGKLPGLDRIVGLVARLETPVDFDAVDGAPVDLVFLLLAPEGAGAEHLRMLARVSRLLRDKAVVDRLRETPDAAGLRAALTSPPCSTEAA